MNTNILRLLAVVCAAFVVSIDATCTQIPGCTTCPNPDPTCETCDAGKQPILDTTTKLATNECEECTSNCKVCVGDTDKKCKECDTGYVLKTNGKCEDCSVSNCKTCTYDEATTTATCTACNDKYALVSGACEACFTNCDKCSSKTICTQCKAAVGTALKYELKSDGKACAACPSDCSACSGVTDAGVAKCTACKDTFYLSSDACVACTDSNCDKCKSDGTACEDGGCSTGYYNTATALTCTSCSSYECDKCTSTSGVITCDSCNTEYGTVTGAIKMCLVCDDTNCETCTSNGATCSTCKTGYYLNSGTCATCASALTNCVECAADGSTCSTCASGYAPDASTSVCTACSTIDADCTACSDEATCTACGNSKSVLADGSACVSCAVTDCAECDTTADTCTTCASGYFLDSAACAVACTPSDCDTCPAAAATCTGCKPGFWFDSNSCTDCSAVTNCASCASATTCTTCNTGYTLTTAGLCAKCDANCDTTNGDGAATGDCQPSTTTVTVAKCTACKAGYRVDGEACTACPLGCSACTKDASTGLVTCTGTTCLSGRWMSENECAACPSNCAACTLATDHMECATCNTGYALNSDDKSCVKCPTNCQDCTVSSGKAQCKSGKCDVGFGRSGNKEACTACSTLTTVSNCATCGDSNSTYSECTSCSAGYFLNDTKSACMSLYTGCAKAVDESHSCTVCANGYNSTTDGKCFVKCYNCAGDDATCNSAFGTKDNMCYGTCGSIRTTVGSGTPSYERTCWTSDCDSNELDTEYCKTADTTKTCRSCCATDNCNNEKLDGSAGFSQSSAADITYNMLLLVGAIALLLQ